MSPIITIEPLAADAFATYGDVIEMSGLPDKVINRGFCERFHDLATLDFSAPDGRAGISIFNAQLRSLPYELEMVERHPLGSQAFLPMSDDPFLVIVAGDNDGVPVDPRAFLTAPGQGVNYFRGTWHGVLTPLSGAGMFAVVDRIGQGENLEEHWFQEAYIVTRNKQ